MTLNTHAHVFNLKAILTKETVRILASRAKGHKSGAVVADALDKVLKKADEVGDADALAVVFGEAVSGSEALRKLLKKAGLDDTRVSALLDRVSASAHESAGYERLRSVLGLVDALLDPGAESDAADESLSDYLGFLRIALQPGIDEVTDNLVGQLRRQDATVALTMDILGENPLKRDLALFPKQLEATSRQALRYPGRILPFVKANGHRKGTGNDDSALDYVRKAVESMGFVGVKLYPSLGYDLASVDDVLEYCDREEVPVLMHCNNGGFKRSDDDVDFTHPRHWRKVLNQRALLKVCFGHFGGDECVAAHAAPDIDSKNWTEVIHALMLDFPGRVFADISFQTLPMTTETGATAYLPKLRQFLSDPKTAGAILWGTDYFMVRQRCRDTSYEHFYRKRLGQAAFRTIAETNPQAFLGLNPVRRNIQRYLNFLAQQRATDWAKAGGILLLPQVRQVQTPAGIDLPFLWNPAQCTSQAVLAKYLSGRLAPTYRKDLKKMPDWELALADYTGHHLASTGGLATGENAFALEVSARLKKAGVALRIPERGWKPVEDAARHWARDPDNTIGKLGEAIDRVVLA